MAVEGDPDTIRALLRLCASRGDLFHAHYTSVNRCDTDAITIAVRIGWGDGTFETLLRPRDGQGAGGGTPVALQAWRERVRDVIESDGEAAPRRCGPLCAALRRRGAAHLVPVLLRAGLSLSDRVEGRLLRPGQEGGMSFAERHKPLDHCRGRRQRARVLREQAEAAAAAEAPTAAYHAALVAAADAAAAEADRALGSHCGEHERGAMVAWRIAEAAALRARADAAAAAAAAAAVPLSAVASLSTGKRPRRGRGGGAPSDAVADAATAAASAATAAAAAAAAEANSAKLWEALCAAWEGLATAAAQRMAARAAAAAARALRDKEVKRATKLRLKWEERAEAAEAALATQVAEEDAEEQDESEAEWDTEAEEARSLGPQRKPPSMLTLARACVWCPCFPGLRPPAHERVFNPTLLPSNFRLSAQEDMDTDEEDVAIENPYDEPRVTDDERRGRLFLSEWHERWGREEESPPFAERSLWSAAEARIGGRDAPLPGEEQAAAAPPQRSSRATTAAAEGGVASEEAALEAAPEAAVREAAAAFLHAAAAAPDETAGEGMLDTWRPSGGASGGVVPPAGGGDDTGGAGEPDAAGGETGAEARGGEHPSLSVCAEALAAVMRAAVAAAAQMKQ